MKIQGIQRVRGRLIVSCSFVCVVLPDGFMDVVLVP